MPARGIALAAWMIGITPTAEIIMAMMKASHRALPELAAIGASRAKMPMPMMLPTTSAIPPPRPRALPSFISPGCAGFRLVPFAASFLDQCACTYLKGCYLMATTSISTGELPGMSFTAMQVRAGGLAGKVSFIDFVHGVEIAHVAQVDCGFHDLIHAASEARQSPLDVAQGDLSAFLTSSVIMSPFSISMAVMPEQKEKAVGFNDVRIRAALDEKFEIVNFLVHATPSMF